MNNKTKEKEIFLNDIKNLQILENQNVDSTYKNHINHIYKMNKYYNLEFGELIYCLEIANIVKKYAEKSIFGNLNRYDIQAFKDIKLEDYV